MATMRRTGVWVHTEPLKCVMLHVTNNPDEPRKPSTDPQRSFRDVVEDDQQFCNEFFAG